MTTLRRAAMTMYMYVPIHRHIMAVGRTQGSTSSRCLPTP